MPRQVAMYLIREMTNLSLPEIGRFMGRNHTTVLYSIEKTQEQIEKDDSFASTVNDLKKNIQNH
jgi:chromosomal replication initiator protein